MRFSASGLIVTARRRSSPVPARLVPGLSLAEPDDDGLALARDAGVADALVAQLGPDVPGERIEALRERAAHVDLEQEMHPASKVEAQVHGQRVDRGEPGRRARHEVERDRVRRVVSHRVQLGIDQVARLELCVGVREPDADRVGVELAPRDLDLCAPQRRLGASERVGVHVDRRLGAGDLHRGRFAEEIGQRIDEADDEGNGHRDVDPDGVAVHALRGT
jgi:hypothetical protein